MAKRGIRFFIPMLILAFSFAIAEEALSEDELFPVQRDGKWGYVDEGGTLVIPARFESALRFSDSRGAVMRRQNIFRKSTGCYSIRFPVILVSLIVI